MSFGKSRYVAVAAAVVLVAGLLSSAVARPGRGRGRGPAEKATGGIVVEEADEAEACVELNAHEAKDGGIEGKGTFKWYLGGRDDPDREIVVDVVYVKVEGDEAWFAGICTHDSDGTKEDDWLFVKVMDGGTPARRGDRVWWEWLGEEPGGGWPEDESPAEKVENEDDPANEKTITAGNLVVHSYDD